MRPKHLKSPFKWHQRQVVIEDHIWYVPKRCETDTFVFPGWTHELTFAIDQPINVEFCSGNGDWIAAKALANPHENWVAVEKKFPRVRKIWSKLKNHNIPNLMIICGEGYHVVQTYFSSSTINSIYVNFPDPWPKNAHAKNRLIQPNFIKEMARILKENGSFTFATDDEPYSERVIRDMQETKGFISAISEPFYCHEIPNYGVSFFEELWRNQGKKIRYHIFTKNLSD